MGQILQHLDCRVQGLRLPNNTTITNQMFADDTLLLLDGNWENMDRALNVITRFGATSWVKLNLHKSVRLSLSSTERTWKWERQLDSSGYNLEKSFDTWITHSVCTLNKGKKMVRCSAKSVNTSLDDPTNNSH